MRRRSGLRLAASLCYYCRGPFDENMGRRRTRDHKMPTSRGGSKSDPANIVAACARCNQEKGNMNEEEYRQWIALGRPHKGTYMGLLGLGPMPRLKPRSAGAQILEWLQRQGNRVDWRLEQKPKPRPEGRGSVSGEVAGLKAESLHQAEEDEDRGGWPMLGPST